MKINGFNPELYGAHLVSYSVAGCELNDTYFLAPSAIFPTRLQNNPRLRKITLTFDFEGTDTHSAIKNMSDITAIFSKEANLLLPDNFNYYCILTSAGKSTTKAPWIEQCTFTFVGLRYGSLETVVINESSSIFVEGNCETECIFIIDTEETQIIINGITVNNIKGQVIIDGINSTVEENGVNKFADCELVSFPTLTPGNNDIDIHGTAKVTILYYPIYL